MKRANNQNRFALCLINAGYPASLERWKIYQCREDSDATAHGQVRVVDESGEDYLYPSENFDLVALQRSTDGYAMSIPRLPGCWSQGKTAREAVDNLQTAVREYVLVAQGLGRGPGVRDG